MFYSGVAFLFLAIISLVWLIAAIIRKTNKKIPGIVLAISVVAFIIIAVITGTTSDTANQNTVPSVNTADSSSATESSVEKSEQAKKNDEILKAQYDTYNDGNYMDATGAEVLTNDDGSIKYIQLNVNGNWKDLSKEDQEKYIDLLKAISEPFKDNETYPFMQIQSDKEIVARSGAQDTATVDIVKE